MVTYEHTKVTKMTVMFTGRDSVDIFKVYGETVANFGLSLHSNKINLSHLKSPKVALNRLRFQCLLCQFSLSRFKSP